MVISGAFESLRARLLPGRRKNSPDIREAAALEGDLTASSSDDLSARVSRLRAKGADALATVSGRAEALAVCREICRRELGLRAFDTQLLAAVALYQGKVVEMATGEGKTLVAVFAAFLNHVAGQKTHVAVPNPYLAERDYTWTQPAYARLGMRSGLIVQGQRQGIKRRNYSADVAYSTFSELGFDYLRDNTMKSLESMVQSAHECVIIDEVDSILIDEGRTPLIISVPVQPDTSRLIEVDAAMSALADTAFEINTRQKWANFTDAGVDALEHRFIGAGLMAAGTGLFDVQNMHLSHAAIQALRAHKVYRRNEDYVVRDNQVVLVNPQSGRLMPGRRLADGLHQALEAKEGVEICPESRSIASISVQNYFKRYAKISGMSGTVLSDREELRDIYGLETVGIPSHRPLRRIDHPDHVVETLAEKQAMVIDLITAAHSVGRPVLVGTTTIEQSEAISARLSALGISHNVLNALQTDSEARIIAEAGRLGAVTIATNMAGRGTDIQLGGTASRPDQGADATSASSPAGSAGNPDHEAARIRALGGLLVIGTEKADCRRIDNQLRGRSGRQGDPGESRFILSLEDPFLQGMLEEGGAKAKDMADMDWRRSAFRAEQRRREAASLKVRLNLLKLDNVLNEQRSAIFAERMEILQSQALAETAAAMRLEVVETLVSRHCGEPDLRDPDLAALAADCAEIFNLDAPIDGALADLDPRDGAIVTSGLATAIDAHLSARYAVYAPEALNELYRVVLLEVLDESWQRHYEHLDILIAGIGLRSLGKRDPVAEFRTEAFDLFERMMAAVPEAFCRSAYATRPRNAADQNAILKSLLGIKTGG